MKRWYHEVDVEWLKARKGVLTATDIVKLLPEYKRYLKAGDPGKLMPGFAALWAEKTAWSEPDPSSTGAAARGHIMEPWAVQAWNDQSSPQWQMSHWDDAIIVNNGLGFSPDALNVDPIYDIVKYDIAGSKVTMLANSEGRAINQPNRALEIKSYEPAHHMKSCITEKMDHDELMQLAVAFLVIPNLQEIALVFYCPDALISMAAFEYTRDDLEEQIKLAEDVFRVWKEQVKLCDMIAEQEGLEAIYSEQEIYDEYLKETTTDAVAQENAFLLRM